MSEIFSISGNAIAKAQPDHRIFGLFMKVADGKVKSRTEHRKHQLAAHFDPFGSSTSLR